MKPREMLVGKLVAPEELSVFRDKVKGLGKKIVFTAGSWDMIHVGQMRYLTEAKRLGDVLVVGVTSNQSIRAVKGPNKPIMDEWIRAESLCFLKCVDFVTIIPLPSCKTTVELLQPDVFVSVKEDYTGDHKNSVEYKTVTSYGGKFTIIPRQSLYLSTSQIAKRVIGGEFAELLKGYMDESNSPIKERYTKSEK